MQISEPRLRSLLTQAERNATNGKLAAAETMYRQILDEAPESDEAWAGLAAVVTDPDNKRSAYDRALELNPGNAQALAGLAELDGRPLPPEVEAAPKAPEAQVEFPTSAAVVTSGPALDTAMETLTPAAHVHEATETEYALVCYRHPNRATSLRCYNCDRPICINCANKTPVGYICPECQRDAEDAFYNSKPTDYLIAAAVSFPISLLAGFLLLNFNFGFFFYIIIFFVSGAIGSFIGRITKRAIGGRRGRYLPHLVVAMMILGVLIPAVPAVLAIFTGNLRALTVLIGPGIYLFVAGGAAYWQMR